MQETMVYMDIDKLIPYENNPRKNDKAVDYVANSIKEFGFKVPIIVDENNVVVAGHTRLKASKKLGLGQVPVIVATDLTDDQIKAFRLADNKVGELSEWDDDKLSKEIESLQRNLTEFGFEEMTEAGELIERENPYTSRIEIPFYEPTGIETNLKELADTSVRDDLVREINQSDVPQDIADFLILASQRHVVFDYRKIAEYYSNASDEVKDLMEKSALVIIDYNDAIKRGYVRLQEEALEMVDDE